MKASISGNIELAKFIIEDMVESETKHYGLNTLFFAAVKGTEVFEIIDQQGYNYLDKGYNYELINYNIN